jgi:hypothetical protein
VKRYRCVMLTTSPPSVSECLDSVGSSTFHSPISRPPRSVTGIVLNATGTKNWTDKKLFGRIAHTGRVVIDCSVAIYAGHHVYPTLPKWLMQPVTG